VDVGVEGMQSEPVSETIHWPERHHPDVSGVHVKNHLEIQLSPRAVWDRLIHAKDWPEWYPNAANVRLLNDDGDALKLGTQFRWKTFGMNIECVVEEFEPAGRLAWSSKSFGMSVYHAWLITERPGGCHVLTEETQNGFVPRIAKLLMPGQMHKYHQIWLEQLAIRAGAPK